MTGDETQGTMGETSGNEAGPAMSGIVKGKKFDFVSEQREKNKDSLITLYKKCVEE